MAAAVVEAPQVNESWKILDPSESTPVVRGKLLNLEDGVKRHVVVGIALNNVVVPELKKYINFRLRELFSKLKSEKKINNMAATVQELNQWGLKDGGFKYKEPSPKEPEKLEAYRQDRMNYQISNHNELAKLFLLPYMTHFHEITDDVFEASAALNILSKAKCFTRVEQCKAHLVRIDVRNPWAHCNFNRWDIEQYMHSFSAMEMLVKSLDNPPGNIIDTQTVLASLQEWKENGIKLIGNQVDRDLFIKIVSEFSQTMKELQKVKAVFDEGEFEQLVALQNKLKQSQERIMNKLEFHGNVLHEHSGRLASLEEKSQSNFESSTPMFTVPKKNPKFTGRTRQLEELKQIFQSDSDYQRNNIVVSISGLGGVGKTSLALEAAYQLRNTFPGGVYWLTADSDNGDDTTKSSLYGLASRMGHVSTDIKDNRLFELVTGNLRKLQERSLVIVDNLDEEHPSNLANNLVNGRWIQESRVSMIITSRLKAEVLEAGMLKYLSEAKTLGCFDLDEGVQFLIARTGMALNKLDCQDIVLELGGLPLGDTTLGPSHLDPAFLDPAIWTQLIGPSCHLDPATI